MVKRFDALIDMLMSMGFEWEILIDEEEASMEFLAKGSVNGVDIKIHCNPKECKVYAPEYHAAAPCYSKPAPAVAKCVDVVVERVNELIEKTAELAELAGVLAEKGFKISREDKGIYAVKPLNDGLIEIAISADGSSTLKLEIRTRAPIKIVIAATELAELAEQLKL